MKKIIPQKDEEKIRALMRNAEQCQNAGDLEEALNNFKQALKLDPSNKNIKEEITLIEENFRREEKKKETELFTRSPQVLNSSSMKNPNKRKNEEIHIEPNKAIKSPSPDAKSEMMHADEPTKPKPKIARTLFTSVTKIKAPPNYFTSELFKENLKNLPVQAYVPTPAKIKQPTSNYAVKKQKPKKQKLSKIEKHNIGYIGEALVCEKLKSSYGEQYSIIDNAQGFFGKHKTTNGTLKAIWHNKKGETGLPYDLTLYETTEGETIKKIIEVKATTSCKPGTTNAKFSSEEIKVMRAEGDNYFLWRVYGVKPHEKDDKLLDGKLSFMELKNPAKLFFSSAKEAYHTALLEQESISIESIKLKL